MELKRYQLRTLFWECTLRCNMTCRHCGSDCKKIERSADMPLGDFLPVLEEIKAHQPKAASIVFTIGGEPLVRDDIMECGREIRSRGFAWGMVSNGLLIDAPTMRELSHNGLCSLAVDVDGLRDSHNWLRNDETSYDRVFEAIGHIRRAPRLVWDVITCVHPGNIDELPELRRMLVEAGVRKWRCFTIVPMGRADRNAALQLSEAQFLRLMRFIVETREQWKIDLNYACEGFLGDFEMRARSYPFYCGAGLSVASVRADGAISGCLSIRSHYEQGNIYRDSFWDVWVNRFRAYRDRDWMRTGLCDGCEVYDRCLGNGMHLRRDDGSLMKCHYQSLKRALEQEQI